jgi:propionyl-CoA carboxylase alpha chain
LEGWAIEARVYAEDPFRNFLPSIGRLVRYNPPPESAHVRVDTGVKEGGEISMYYDPMIAKLLSYGSTREEATAHMRKALDRFYIRGVSHNIPFLASLLSKERFVKGNLSTNFIADEYKNGFNVVDLPPKEPAILVAVAAGIHRRNVIRSTTITGQMPGRARKLVAEWVVTMGEKAYPVVVSEKSDVIIVKFGRDSFEVKSDWSAGNPLFIGTVNGQEVCVQVDRNGVGYRLFHSGSQADVTVLSALAANLLSQMPRKVPPDMSRFLLSPMPGLLVSVAVKEGQEVKAGEELAVVEAMKMMNILRAERDAKVKKVAAQAGGSLSVDQVILEFV